MTTYTAKVPTNIAVLKYWGKRDPERQWPANSSLSLTLDRWRTETKAAVSPVDEIVWEGCPLPSDDPRARKALRHLARVRQVVGATRCLRIETHNTFPTAAGIASSASGMAALTVAAVAALTDAATLAELDHKVPRSTVATLARMGSGSACRSLFPGWVWWDCGSSPDHQEVGTLFPAGHWPLVDIGIVFAAEPKAIPSTTGHQAAWSSALFATRLAGIQERASRFKDAIAHRDFAAFGELCEAETLDMHAVMLTGSPSCDYIPPTMWQGMTWVRETRAAGSLPAYFTVDAGPTLHLFCEPADAEKVEAAVRCRFPTCLVLRDSGGPGLELVRC